MGKPKAKEQSAKEKLYEKYGIGGTKTKTTSNKNDKGKQSNNSAPSSREKNTRESLYEKYGVTGTKPSTKSGANKTVTTPQKYTPKDISDFSTETKNAYTKAKDKTATKTTIKSQMSDEDRNSRIKEIQDELKKLSMERDGLGRARSYGYHDYIDKRLEENKSKSAKLNEELKSLERVGTFTASEMKQFEIDDAKKKKAALGTYNPTARVAPSQAEAYMKQVSDIHNAQAEINTLKKQKDLYDEITKFGDVVNEDTLGGQWKANYRSGDLSEKANKAMSEYIRNPTEENREIAFAYDAFEKAYRANNEKALDDENVESSWLTKNMAGYLPQLKNQILPQTIGGVIGGLAFGKAGKSIGAGIGSYAHSYDNILGSVYRELLAMGLDEETALRLAEDEAMNSSAIEGAETAAGWALSGIGGAKAAIGNAAKASVAKGSTNAITKLAANMASKEAVKAANKAAKSAAQPLWRKGLGLVLGVGRESGTEYLEEFTQGGVSIATREKAMSILDNEIGQYGAGNIDLHNRPIYKNADGTISTVDSVTFQIDDKFVLLPTIVRDDKGNAVRLEDTEEIIAHYYNTGEYLGEFDTEEEANVYATRLHFAQEYYYSKNKSTDADDSLIAGTAKVIKDAVTGNAPEYLAEMNEQGIGGAITGGMMGGIRTTAANIVTQYFNAKTVKLQNEIADTIIKDEESLNALIEEGKASGEGTVSAKIAQKVEQAKAKGEVTRTQVKQLIEANEVYIKAEESKTATTSHETEKGSTIPVEEKASLKTKNNPSYERLEALSRSNEAITAEEVKKVTGFGDRGAELVANIANTEGTTFSQAERAVKTAYLTGYSQPDLSIKKVPFATKTQENAFTAGQIDRLADISLGKEKAKTATVYGSKSGFTENEYSAKLTQAEREMVSTIAKDFGMSIKMVDKIIANIATGKEANASHYDGKMDISSTAQAGKAIYNLVLHEGGHRMEQFATDEWNVLANALYERAEQLGRRTNLGAKQGLRFDAIKALHENAGVTKDTSGYFGEVVMRELETIFSSPEEFNNWRAEIDGNVQVKSAWQKFVDFIAELIEDIKRVIAEAKMSKEARSEARKELAELERIKELYAEAYLSTKEAVAERTKEVQGKQAQKNTDTNGGVSFDLKGVRADGIEVYETSNEVMNMSAKERKKLYLRLMNKEYAGRTARFVRNGHTYYAAFDKTSLSKAMYGDDRSSESGLKALTRVGAEGDIFDLVENSTYHHSSPDKSDHKNTDYFDYFIKTVQIDNKVYDLLADVKKQYGKDGGYVYTIVLTDNKKIKAAPTKASQIDALNVVETALTEGQSVTSDTSPNNVKLPQNPKSVKGDFSLQDSEGNTLTEAQAEYFKDSKVRDKDGNLLVMYQGASEDFSVFDRKKSNYANLYGRGFYFTKSESHASRYGNTRAYYLDIKHPVSTTETTITKSQLRKFLQAVTENEDYSFENYGYGATVDSVLASVYGKSDFLMLNDVSQTAIGDLVEAIELFNEVNGTVYDGITLDTETVTFNSEQAKLTTNKNPTSNPDIRFSLKEPVEETKNLVAVHNTTVDKLLGALKLGGLPSPSIAITKTDVSHEKFGDISLVFRKDSISPTDRRNKIYSGDAYTPTGVRVEYDVDDDVVQAFNKRLKELTPEWENERLPSVDAGTATAENDSLYGAYERNDRAKLAFLREKGKAPKVAMRTPRLSYFVSNDTVVALAKAFSAKQLSDIENTSEGIKQYKNAFLKVIRDTEDSRFVESGIYSAEEASAFDIAETARKAAKVKENKYKIKKEVDNRKTYEMIDKKFTKALKAEYRAWIDENTKDAIIDKGIRNNRDLFTPSGNRRSFKQLHEPYNLTNIIKQMFSGEDKGIALFGGSPIGAAQHLYSSIADVKADSGRLQQLEQEEYDKIRDQIEGDVLELAQKMQIRSDVFAVRDLLSEAIGKKTKQQADSYLKRESQGWANYSPDFTNELWDIRKRILNMPTEYFEAKPQRAVSFNEVALAVLPKGMTELRKQLENAGVQRVVYYNKAIEGDRLKKVNSVPDVNFSLKEDDSTTAKDTTELLDMIEHFKNEFKLTKFAKADQKKLEKMTREVLKEYNSQADFEETFKDIDELYRYMANGEDGHPAVWEDVYDRAYNIADKIVKTALVTDDYTYQEYKSLRDYLRNTPMKFDATYDNVPSSYENFNDFRKQNFGRLKFTKDGMGIDSVYQELAGLYPEFFDAEEQITTEEMLERIVDVLDEIQPTEVNPFSREMEQTASYLANDITSRFFDVPQAKPTFADKAERRVVEAHIAGGKKVEAVRQQKDAKIKKLIEAQREKAKKQIDKVRQQRDARVEKERVKRRESIAKMGETQKAKVLRSQIMRHASDLSQKLLRPSDNQHIPQELQGAVAKLLECINLESNYTYDTGSHSYKKSDDGLPTRRTQAFNELKKVYAEISSSVVVDPDLMGEDGLLSDVISLADKRIADMTSSELDTVWQTIRAIEASISTANRLFSEGKFAVISDVAEALRADNAGKSGKTELKYIGGLQRLAALDMLTPETYLHYLGGAGDSIFRMMRDAQDKHISIMKEVADFTHKELKDVNVNSLENTLHTVKLGGEDVQLSTAQLMELYVLMNREQAVEHILVGGILPDVIKTKGIKKITKAEPIRNVSVAEVSKALSTLTDEQKKIADKLQKYVSTVLSGYGNEASMKVYNYEKFLEKNYWTIRTNKQEIASDVSKDTAVTTVANKGMAKGTKPHANTSVRIGSIFDTFAAHSSDMATYAAWLGTSEDVNRIRNFVFWEDGVRKGTVKGILDTVHGTQGSKYLEKLLTDISIGVKGTDNMNPFDKLIGSYKAASVGANLRVVIQQPTAILRALDMIDARHLAEGAVRPLKGWEKAKKYAPIAQWKDWGHFDINTGRQMKDVLFDNASLVEKTKQVGMWGASMADSLAWGQLWNAVEAETKANHKELKVGSDEYYKAVAKRFTQIVDHTQVVDGILQRSQIMRSADNLTKMATSFMGEPTKQYNMAISAAYEVRNSKGDARKKAINRLGRTAMSLAVAGIINAAAQSIIDAMRDDDKEKDYWEKWLAALKGDGDDTKFINSNIADTVNPLNYVPFAKDIVSIMQGYDVKRMDAEAITKTFNAVTNMYKAVTGTGKYTVAEASAALFAEIARLFGIPVANVKRDIKSLVMATAIETDSYLMQYRMEKAMLNINYAGNSKNFVDILFNAYNNDKEAYNVIYNDMIKSGYDAEKIESGMESRMKKAEGVEKVSDLPKRYMTPADERKYDNALSKVRTSNAWESANAKQRKDAKASLYEFLTSTSDDMIETRAEAKAAGVDETEYTLWKLAIEMADQPEGQKGSGSYDYKEKAEALNLINLGDEEMAYFFGKGLNETSKKELEETLDAGIDIQEYANFKAAVSDMKADKYANGKSIPNSKKRKVVSYLNNADLTDEEWRYFYYEIMNYKK